MDFREGERKAVTVVDVVLNEFLEKFVLCSCPHAVPKGECFPDVCLSFLVGDVIDRPVGSFLDESLEFGPVWVESKDWF